MKPCLLGVKICSFYITFSDLKVNGDTVNFNEAEVKQCHLQLHGVISLLSLLLW